VSAPSQSPLSTATGRGNSKTAHPRRKGNCLRKRRKKRVSSFIFVKEEKPLKKRREALHLWRWKKEKRDKRRLVLPEAEGKKEEKEKKVGGGRGKRHAAPLRFPSGSIIHANVGGTKKRWQGGKKIAREKEGATRAAQLFPLERKFTRREKKR